MDAVLAFAAFATIATIITRWAFFMRKSIKRMSDLNEAFDDPKTRQYRIYRDLILTRRCNVTSIFISLLGILITLMALLR